MKAFVIGFLLLSSWALSAQVDRDQLNGTWCLVDIVEAWSPGIEMSKEELAEFMLDMVSTRFHITEDNQFLSVFAGMTLEEAKDAAMILGTNLEPNVFALYDEQTETALRFEVIKFSGNELIFKFYDDSFGMTFSCRRC